MKLTVLKVGGAVVEKCDKGLVPLILENFILLKNSPNAPQEVCNSLGNCWLHFGGLLF